MKINFYPIYDRVEMCVRGELVDISVEVDATAAEEALHELNQALNILRNRGA